MCDTFVGAVVGKICGGELPAVVGVEYTQLAPTGLLRLRLNAFDGVRGALQPSGRAHGTRPRRGRWRAGFPAAAVQEGEGKGAGKVEEGTRKLTAYSNQAEVGRRIELDVWG